MTLHNFYGEFTLSELQNIINQMNEHNVTPTSTLFQFSISGDEFVELLQGYGATIGQTLDEKECEYFRNPIKPDCAVCFHRGVCYRCVDKRFSPSDFVHYYSILH